MKKITLIGASWCPVTAQAKKLWEDLRREDDFDYEFIDIQSKEGRKLVKKYSIVSIPKTIIDGKVVFHGVPERKEVEKFVGSR